jgi:hypothetical protein
MEELDKVRASVGHRLLAGRGDRPRTESLH